MKLFLLNNRFRACYSSRFFSLFAFLCVLVFLSSCAPIGRYPSVTVGDPKNSLPFFEKDLVEELHSIAVPPFMGDQHTWHELAIEILSSSKRITVTPSGKMNAALKNSKKDLSSLRPEERPAFIAGIGRAMQTDAVMNGVILDKEGHNEMILQVISSKDARIIWWQAVDFTFSNGGMTRPNQKKVLSSLLSPFLMHAGKREVPVQLQTKQEPEPSSRLNPQAEEPPRPEAPPAKRPRPNSKKKPVRIQEPLLLPDDISPM